MCKAIYDKMTALWLVMVLVCGLGLPIIPAWATGFTPVSQCFRNAGAPNWKMQLYSSGVVNTSGVPLTAASGADVAGYGWLRLTNNTNNQSGTAYYNLPINITQLGIQASFSYTAWGGTGADGISLFLFDGSTVPTNFVQGVYGGGLGYCQQGANFGTCNGCTSCGASGTCSTSTCGTSGTSACSICTKSPNTGCQNCIANGTCKTSNNCGSNSNTSCSSCSSTDYCVINYGSPVYQPLQGLSNAVVGVGIDDYGNFANNGDRCTNYGENGQTNKGGTGKPYGTIAVRGPGNLQAGYNWLSDTASTNTITNPSANKQLTPTWYTGTGTTSTASSTSLGCSATPCRPTSSQFYRNVLVNISPTSYNPTAGTYASTYNITTSWITSPPSSPTSSPTYTPLLSVPYPAGQGSPPGIAYDTAFTTPSTWVNNLPPTVKFGFAASTGGSTNYHEIQDAYFTEGLPDIAITQNTASASGGLGNFVVTVTNLGSTVATNASLTATFTGLSNVLWSCIATTNSSCPAASGAGAPSNASFSLGIVGNVTFLFQGIAAQGATISDTVSITGASGFNDADLSSNTSSSSMTIGSSSASNNINISQLPQTSNSATANTVTSGQVQTNTDVYVSQYNSSNWWGDLLSYGLTTSGSGSSAILTGLNSLADWSASCNLTGGKCPAVNGSGSTATMTAQTPSSRTILSWNGSTGIPFAWNSLTSAEQTALSSDPVIASSSLYKCNTSGSAATCTGSDVLNYLIGVRGNEQADATPGPFRTRSGVLGDIVDSSPVYVGTPVANYPTSAPWSDLLYSSSTMPENKTTNSYATYQTNQAGRMQMVYVASNDGLLHGFQAGQQVTSTVTTCSNSRPTGGTTTSGNTTTTISYVKTNCVVSSTTYTYTITTTTSTYTNNTGTELLAYMPQTVALEIAQNNTTAFLTNYNFTDPSYTHRFFVNQTPGIGELYYNNAWHTWLVGGLGGGGPAIYALDVTEPTTNASISYAPIFSQSNASSLVVNELNTSNIQSVCAIHSPTNYCLDDFGWNYGTPIISRMHNGSWAVIFGNGYNSNNGTAAIFIATITNTSTCIGTTPCTSLPTWTVYDLETNTQMPNGINYVTPADLDGDNVVDYLYAGDLFGNIWRFDVTSSNPSNWTASTFGVAGSSPGPLFTATNAAGIAQPITTAVALTKLAQTGSLLPREIILFGTGKNIDASDLLPNNTTYGVQSIYGVWDWNMSAWNTLSGSDYDNLAAPQTIYRSNLVQQTITQTSGNYRTLSGNTICWADLATCYLYNQFGFYLDLSSPGEEVIYNPLLVSGLFMVNTTIPSSSTQGLTCSPGLPPGGWTMAINPINGGVLLNGLSVFANSSGQFANINGSPVSGLYVSAVGTPQAIQYNSINYIINKTASGGVNVSKFQPNSCIGTGCTTTPTTTGGKGQRLNWIQLR